LGAGVTPVSAPDIRSEFDVAYGELGLILLAAPLLLSMVIEGPILLASDRLRRGRVATFGLVVMGVFMIAAAAATSPWMLALGLAGWGSASGITCGVSQGALMDAYPQDRERWMTRWTLMGSLGDAATPLLIMAAAAAGMGWRTALVGAGALHLVHAVVMFSVVWERGAVPETEASGDDSEDSEDTEDAEDGDGWWAQLRAGLRNRQLLLWLGAGALCCLLDEIFVAFGAVFLRAELGATVTTQSLAFAACAVLEAVGLVVTDRLLRRFSPRHLLMASCLACAAAFLCWLGVRSRVGSIVLLAVVGLCTAPQYPICAARAYAAAPGKSGLVAAVDQLFSPLPIVAPLVIGLVADQFGVTLALLLLLAQPVGVFVLALALRPADHEPRMQG